MTERSAPQKSAEAYRTISEVAEDLDLPQHVLRFWETRFPQVRPLKRAGGRRFYRPEDVDLLRAVKALLYGEGYTIKGVQRLMREQGPRATAALANSRNAGGQERVSSGDGAGTRDGAPPSRRNAGQVVAPFEALMPVESLAPDQEDEGSEAPPQRVEPLLDANAEPDGKSQVPPDGRDPDDQDGLTRAGVVARLDAVVVDLLECERLLAKARQAS